jgi:hypothetical protein
MKGSQIEYEAEKALEEVFKEIPFIQNIQIEKCPRKQDFCPDFLVRLQLPEEEQLILSEVRSNGQPRLARDAINQLYRYTNEWPNSYSVFIAPYISASTAQICKNQNVGYVDLSGNCYLNFNKIYINKEGKPNTQTQKRDLRSLYSPKAERILRVLLTNPKQKWKLQKLAKEASVSIGQASNVKKLLADREWLNVALDGFELEKPELLLNEWQTNYSFRRNKRYDYYSLEGNSSIEIKLAQAYRNNNLKYALTGFSALERLAPYIRNQRVMAFVEEDIEQIVDALPLKKVESGANVMLLQPYDQGVFYGMKSFDDVNVATPIQVYLDLYDFRGRGQEAAEHLLKEVIKEQW